MSQWRLCSGWSAPAVSAAMVVLALAGPAPAVHPWSWSETFLEVNSDGVMGSAQNGMVTTNLFLNGNSWQVGLVRIEGTLTNNSFPPNGSAPHQARILVEKLSSSPPFGVAETWVSGPLHGQQTEFSGAVTIGPLAFDASSLGWVNDGQTLRIKFFETYDNTYNSGQIPVVDARWTTVTVTFYSKHPAEVRLPVVRGSPLPTLNTQGSDYLTAMALFSAEGGLLMSDDANDDPTGAAYISLDGLPPGEYHLCCTASGAGFDDGFEAVPSPAASEGNLRLSWCCGGVAYEDDWRMPTHADTVVWFEVTIGPPLGDFDGDLDVDLVDFATFAAGFTG